MQVDRKAEGWRHAVGWRSLAQSVVHQAVWDYKALVNAGYIVYGEVTVTQPEKNKLPTKVLEMERWSDVRHLVYWLNKSDAEDYSLQWWLDAGGITDVDAETIRTWLYSQGYFEDLKTYELQGMEEGPEAGVAGVEGDGYDDAL